MTPSVRDEARIPHTGHVIGTEVNRSTCWQRDYESDAAGVEVKVVDGGRERRVVAEWLRGGKGVEGGKSVRATEGRVRREFFACRLGTMGEPVERGVEEGGGAAGRREERGPPLRPARGERGGWEGEGKEGGKWRLMESRRRKIPKETTRLAISFGGWWRFYTTGERKSKLFLSVVGFFSGVSLRDFSEGKLKGNGWKLFLLALDFWHVSSEGCFSWVI